MRRICIRVCGFAKVIRTVSARDMSVLVADAFERGQVAESTGRALLQSMGPDKEVAFTETSRQELVQIYSRRARHNPDNAHLRQLARELDSHDGETALLGSITTDKFEGHVFLNPSASALIGEYLESGGSPTE